MSNPKKPTIGWGNPNPYSSRSRFHFFGTDSRSLCGKWANLFGTIELVNEWDDHTDNCSVCRARVVAYRKTQTQEEKP